ncbi:nucleoside deaminase [Rubrivivax sp. RP6-9]|uniref:nucleoside deaminase n=1 Tax=Rubrivivax sp. RP6-9 TaxID=3415750 RepID=UPI003CC69AAA
MPIHPDPKFMEAALAEARGALEAGNLPIGAAIVHGDQIVSLGRNAIDVPGDDTHHAELSAIQAIAPFLVQHKRQCTLYTTLEPCMMCLGAMINAGIESLVIARPDPDMGALRLLPHAEYYDFKRRRLNVTSGFMASEAQALLTEYVRRTGLRRHLSDAA